MAHSYLIIDAIPQVHDEFKKRVSELEFPVNGQLATGVCRPVVSEMRLYNVRIPVEHIPAFLAKIDAIVPEDVDKKAYIGGDGTFWQKQGFWFVVLMTKVARWFTPFKYSPKTKEPKQLNLSTWYYPIHIGYIDDPQQTVDLPTKTKVTREVL